MQEYHIDQTLDKLSGPPREQITHYNQWAATGLNKFHTNSNAVVEFVVDGVKTLARLNWNSNFPNRTLIEKNDIANFGGVALSWFVMSVLQDYVYVEQSEIGDGVDYRFMKSIPDEDELNFFIDEHYVEVSGILHETPTNTLENRVRQKHEQIIRGRKSDKPSSVIVTLFSQPKVVKTIHR